MTEYTTYYWLYIHNSYPFVDKILTDKTQLYLITTRNGSILISNYSALTMVLSSNKSFNNAMTHISLSSDPIAYVDSNA